MSLKIASNFGVNTQDLDPNERFIRDNLELKIVNWAKFRYTINIGNNAANLRPLKGSISDDVKEAYRELAKSHYEVITSLGSAKLSLGFAAQSIQKNGLLFKKSFKDFYFHVGCVLDNLARLIYIVNDPQSAAAVYQKGSLKGKLKRHWVDWGRLLVYPGYARLKRSKALREIINIRNAFTHGWSCPILVGPNAGVPYWPYAIRTKRDYFWPYDEFGMMKRRYRKYIPVIAMMETDFTFMEEFQDKVFAKLARDIVKFERCYGLVIQ